MGIISRNIRGRDNRKFAEPIRVPTELSIEE